MSPVMGRTDDTMMLSESSATELLELCCSGSSAGADNEAVFFTDVGEALLVVSASESEITITLRAWPLGLRAAVDFLGFFTPAGAGAFGVTVGHVARVFFVFGLALAVTGDFAFFLSGVCVGVGSCLPCFLRPVSRSLVAGGGRCSSSLRSSGTSSPSSPAEPYSSSPVYAMLATHQTFG